MLKGVAERRITLQVLRSRYSVTAESEDVVFKDLVQIIHLIVVLQIEFGFQGEREGPEDIGRPLPIQHHSDDFVLFMDC